MSQESPPADMSIPAAMKVSEAVLHTGAGETHYRRAGYGSPAVLLFEDRPGDGLGDRVFGYFAEDLRVIAPRVSSTGGSVVQSGRMRPITDWLRDLIDGLGLTRPGIIADEPFGAAAIELMSTDPDLVCGVLVIRADHPERTPRAAAAVDQPADLDPGVLVVTVGRADPTDRDLAGLAEGKRFLNALTSRPQVRRLF